MPEIKAVFFDLDDTLFDCSGLLVENARKRAAKAMVAAGLPVSEKKAYSMQVSILRQLGPLENIFDRMCDRLHIKGDGRKRIIDAGFNAYNIDKVEEIAPFPDVLPTLGLLREKGVKSALITSGIFERQRNKIRQLGLQDKFDLILIHDIEKDPSKEGKFLEAMKKLRLKPRDVAVVGDKINSEIKIANKLGMASVRILKGRFSGVKPRTELEEPDFTVKKIGELPCVLGKIRRSSKKENGLRIVAIGGGTGLPCVLEGLKAYTKKLTAIVTVTDTGRSSGMLRREMNMLPPGDIRNCIIALSDSEKLMKDLFLYRFSSGKLEDISLGNLFIAALTKVTGSFEKAVKKTADILAIKGRVLPSTLEDVNICAELEDGTIIEGEDNLIQRDVSPEVLAKRPLIKMVFLKPSSATILPEAKKAIAEADLIVIGPGSLYTSVITNLLVRGMKEAIVKSRAKKVFVCNVMSQVNQTYGYALSDHIKAVERHLGKDSLDFVVYNTEKPNPDILKNYEKSQSFFIQPDLQNLKGLRAKLVGVSLAEKSVLFGEKATKQKLLRHDGKKLAKLLVGLAG